MARGRGSGKRSGSKPTGPRRAYTQEVKERYMAAREEAQLLGLIPTTPEGAVKRVIQAKREVVQPSSQTDAPQVGTIMEALRNGWAVPEHRKPDLVDELLAIVNDLEIPPKTRVAAFNALRMADREQWERDHPQQAKALGVSIHNTNNTVVVGEVFSDIDKLRASYELITGTGSADSQTSGEAKAREEDGEQADSEAARGIRADGDEESVDEAEPYNPEEEPEAD